MSSWTSLIIHHRTLLPRHHSLPKNRRKCHPCVRYDVLPMSQAAHRLPIFTCIPASAVAPGRSSSLNSHGKSYWPPQTARHSITGHSWLLVIVSWYKPTATNTRLEQTASYERPHGLVCFARSHSPQWLNVAARPLDRRNRARRGVWSPPKRGGGLPRQPWDRMSRFVPPKTAPISFIKFIWLPDTNTPTRARSICTPDTAIFAVFATRRRET